MEGQAQLDTFCISQIDGYDLLASRSRYFTHEEQAVYTQRTEGCLDPEFSLDVVTDPQLALTVKRFSTLLCCVHLV
jgi:hypothetical protein